MTLTPKQKAADLVDKFLDHAWADLELKGDEYSKSLRDSAKQCAIIHVDEILKEIPMYIGNLNPRWKFYNDVKDELQKI